MTIQKDKVVTIHYTLTDNEGTVIDSSEGFDPLHYLHGAENIVPGLENALEGKQKDDHIEVAVAPEEGYGLRDEKLVTALGIEQFAHVPELDLGMQFRADGPKGPIMITVVDIQDDQVIVDGNHPLAGVILNFAVDVVDVRQATEEEINHGHVHGPGGAH